MKTVKVGDRVRVVARNGYSGHRFGIGDVVTHLGNGEFDDSYGVSWFLDPDEYEPIAPALIVAGSEYTSYNGHEWKCIFVDGDYAWLAPNGVKSAAYVFTTDGTNISQGGGEWNIKLAPVVETVKFRGGVRTGYLDNRTLHPDDDEVDHKFNMTVEFIDGKPDWSTAKVTEA